MQYESETKDVFIKWHAQTKTILVRGKNKDDINEKFMSAVSVSKVVAEHEPSEYETSEKFLGDVYKMSKWPDVKQVTDNLIAVNRSLREHSAQLKEPQSLNADSELCRLKLGNFDFRMKTDRLTELINNVR